MYADRVVMTMQLAVKLDCDYRKPIHRIFTDDWDSENGELPPFDGPQIRNMRDEEERAKLPPQAYTLLMTPTEREQGEKLVQDFIGEVTCIGLATGTRI